MGLWVVNDTICRSRMRDVPGPSAVREARIRGDPGAFWPLGRVPAKGGCRLREGNRVGGGRGLGSGHWESYGMSARAIEAAPGRASRGG